MTSAKKPRRFTIGVTVCSLAYLWINSILDFYTWSRKTRVSNNTTTGKGPINYAPLYFMYTVIISTEIQYTISTYNIGQRFIRLNSSLKALFDANNNGNDNANDYLRKCTETGKLDILLNVLSYYRS